MKKNRKILLIVLAAVLGGSSFFIIYARRNPAVLVTARTVRAAGERMGFDMDVPEVFGTQFALEIERLGIESLSPEAKKRYFSELVNVPGIKMAVAAVSSLPPGHREEAASAAYVFIRDFRLTLSPSDAEKLREYAAGDGRERISAAENYLRRGLSREEREFLGPAIAEFEALISAIAGR